jgi:hypothetical protein
MKRSMFDIVLRHQDELDTMLADTGAVPGAIPRLLALAVAGTAGYGLAIGASAPWVLTLEKGEALPLLSVPIAFVGAFLGALAVCLPSFYFYTQLSGIDASFGLVTAQALRVQATTAVLLLGALPVYAAMSLAAELGWLPAGEMIFLQGLLLPFLLGLYGIWILYHAFTKLAGVLPRTHTRRGNFLRRLVLCWGAVYSAVAPVALYRLLEAFGVTLFGA